MLKHLRIRNFRLFDDLEIGEMGRINLITGLNNSGKTTLLEALFLLSAGGNPQVALNTNVIRGIDSVTGPTETIHEIVWKPMFFFLDVGKHISIQGKHNFLGPLTLEISLGRPDVIELPLAGTDPASVAGSPGARTLAFSFIDSSGRKVESGIRPTGHAIRIDGSDAEVPFSAVFLSSRMTNFREDAVRLGQLRKRKQHDAVADALRVVEPKLVSVEDNSASGQPLIWADIGLPELVPLPATGEGMTRVARLVLAISSAPKRVVLVDEIENGLHHSVMPDLWRVVDRAARKFDVQVVATTHSFECVEAAHRALGCEGFLLHHLEVNDDGNRCVTFGPEALDGAIRHNLEVR